MGTDPVYTKADNQVHYYANDHLGTPQKLVASNGGVGWSGRMSAFGATEINAGSNVNNPMRFAGQDGEKGSYYNYMRDYGPGLGRYVQSDPMGLYDGPNTFSYAYNSAVRHYDPYGLWVPPSQPQWSVDFGAGLGDTITFGLTQRVRENWDIGSVNECSASYNAGIAASAATGFAAGTRAVAKGTSKLGAQYGDPLVDFSHSAIPNNVLKRMSGKFARWLNKKGNKLNGDFVPRNLHWRMDPVYRTKWLSDALRAKHVPFSDARGLLNRVPYTVGGAGYGGASAAATNNMTKPDCSC